MSSPKKAKTPMTPERKAEFQLRFDRLVRDFVDEHHFAGKDHRITMGNLFIKATDGTSFADLPLQYKGTERSVPALGGPHDA